MPLPRSFRVFAPRRGVTRVLPSLPGIRPPAPASENADTAHTPRARAFDFAEPALHSPPQFHLRTGNQTVNVIT